ncbi:MAG: hypothetical protein ABJ388_14500 [Alphaproteobacteria bacterium]
MITTDDELGGRNAPMGRGVPSHSSTVIAKDEKIVAAAFPVVENTINENPKCAKSDT